MTIRHILVPLRGGGQDRHIAVSAFQLAARFSAHVSVLHAWDDWGRYAGVLSLLPRADVDQTEAALSAARRRRRDAARAAFAAAAAEAGIPRCERPPATAESASWIEEPAPYRRGDPLGHLVDLVVAGQPDDDTGALPLRDLVLREGRPMLVVPSQVRPLGQDTVIAWDGSRSATRAVHCALPLLNPGGAVTILQIGDMVPGGLSGMKLATFLAWHGIPATLVRIEPGRRDIATAVMQESTEAHAGLLVMGAYGHGPLRERLFGGVTRRILAESALPLLIAH